MHNEIFHDGQNLFIGRIIQSHGRGQTVSSFVFVFDIGGGTGFDSTTNFSQNFYNRESKQENEKKQ
jgi:hypothetical protein